VAQLRPPGTHAQPIHTCAHERCRSVARARTPAATVTPAVIVRQRKPWRRKEGTFIYFEDNAGVIVNPKGEMKGERSSGWWRVHWARRLRGATQPRREQLCGSAEAWRLQRAHLLAGQRSRRNTAGRQEQQRHTPKLCGVGWGLQPHTTLRSIVQLQAAVAAHRRAQPQMAAARRGRGRRQTHAAGSRWFQLSMRRWVLKNAPLPFCCRHCVCRLRHHGPRGKGVRGPVAAHCQRSQQHCVR
jgi:hypothetical protein